MSVSSMTLPSFLRDRIAEDNLEAHWIHHGDCDSNNAAEIGGFPCDCPWPARIAVECEVKMRVLDLHKPTATGWNEVDGEPSRYCVRCHHQWPCEDIRLLTLPYADHPDLDERWKP